MNFHFSARTVYALIALENISEGIIPLQEIAAKYEGLSLHFLEQIMRTLRTSNIVRSIRGPGGGYVLSRPANKITLKDITLAFEAHERSERYMTDKITTLEQVARTKILTALDDLTLADIKSGNIQFANYVVQGARSHESHPHS